MSGGSDDGNLFGEDDDDDGAPEDQEQFGRGSVTDKRAHIANLFAKVLPYPPGPAL